MRKEYLALERSLQVLRADAASLSEDLDIANMDPREAHQKFIARVNQFKSASKQLEEKAGGLREEIGSLRRTLEDLSSSSTHETSSEDADKYALLVKRDEEMSAFIASYDGTVAGIRADLTETSYMVVALLEHIGKGMEDSSHLPTLEVKAEMESARQFKEKNLQTAQRTMESLSMEKKKREKEMDMLRSSEPKLLTELASLKEGLMQMRHEMDDLQDIDRLRKEFDQTKGLLGKLRSEYLKRRDAMRSQIQSVQYEYETMKKALAANEIGRDLEDTEKRLKHYERGIFELKEFVDSKSRETDYEQVKGLCLKLVDQVNAANIRGSQITSSQAKGW